MGLEPTFPEQTDTVEASAERLVALVQDHVGDGRDLGHIAIGGFSQGGGMALQMAARIPGLGAAFAFSSYLSDDSPAYAATNWPPIMMAHGADDDFILPEWGQATAERLRSQRRPDLLFDLYPNIGHHMVRPQFTNKLLPFLRANFLDDGGGDEDYGGCPQPPTT